MIYTAAALFLVYLLWPSDKPYLSRRALEGLKQYQYKPAGYTFLDNWHQPIWNYITDNWLPPWLAPNLITLTGLFALISVYFMTAVYLPEYEYVVPGEETPRWVYFAIGTAVFFYLHMDCLDGKQARKTKTSSPLGQLFDHGCDALAVHLIMNTMMISLQLKHEWKAIVGIMYVFTPFWLAHWEEYHTGVMVYGTGNWGVTEANYTVVGVHYITALLGAGFWRARPLNALLQATGAGRHLPLAMAATLSQLSVTDLQLFSFSFLGIGLFTQQMIRVFRLAGTQQVASTTLPPAEQGSKTLGRRAAAFHLFQIFVTLGCCVVLMSLPIPGPGYSRVVFGTFGLTYAMQTTRLIMAHMSKEPFSIAAWPIVLMLVQIINHYFGRVAPLALASATFYCVVAGYLHYVISIVGQICDFLNIHALTIKR